MLTRIEVQNYRSFVDAKANLSPFTLVIGENGSGKSNFLRLLRDSVLTRESTSTALERSKTISWFFGQKHFNKTNESQKIHLKNTNGQEVNIADGTVDSSFEEVDIELFNLDPIIAEKSEEIKPKARIESDGFGIVSVLDSLKTGDREDLFNEIERQLSSYIPAIEKLIIRTSEIGNKSLQVREKGISNPFPISELSEGTKLILLILTILHQEQPPRIILLEDIDRGLHPRLFQRVVEMLRDIVRRKGIQIIATTHNPYLVDEFVGEEESVLIVEKKGAESTITSLADRLESGDTVEDALGSLWFSGFFGGVPTLG